jgi:hypothetical protein
MMPTGWFCVVVFCVVGCWSEEKEHVRRLLGSTGTKYVLVTDKYTHVTLTHY